MVRVGLQSIIDWESYGYSITGVFKNGEDALKEALRKKVDVILTDIRMPIMDGFELIKQLKQRHLQIHFVILSSFNEFEYTRKAIQLGVKDFILKYQLESEELIRVLNALDFKDRSEDEQKTVASIQAEIENFLLLTRPNMQSSTQDRQKWLQEIPLLSRQLEELGHSKYWITLKPLQREKSYSPSELKALQIAVEEVFIRLRHMKFLGWDQDILHGMICFSDQDAGSQETQEQLMMAMSMELQKTIARNLNIQLVIGISFLQHSDEQLHLLRQSAMKAMDSAFTQGAGIYHDKTEITSIRRAFSEREWLEFYKQSNQLIHFQQFNELNVWFVQYSDSKETDLKSEDWLRLGKMIATQLMDMVIVQHHQSIDKIERHFGELWPLSDYVGKARHFMELSQHVQTVIGKVKELHAFIHAKQGWIQKVKDYVELYYTGPIHLSDVAAVVNYNVNYFSQQFHQETGVSFSNYLTHFRIQKSLLLFQEKNLSTEEIAIRVGYTNPNYFVKVFKKVMGKTILEYKHSQQHPQTPEVLE